MYLIYDIFPYFKSKRTNLRKESMIAGLGYLVNCKIVKMLELLAFKERIQIKRGGDKME